LHVVTNYPEMVSRGIDVALSARSGFSASLWAHETLDLIVLLCELNAPLLKVFAGPPPREPATPEDLSRPPAASYDSTGPVSLAFLISLFTGQPESSMPPELQAAVMRPAAAEAESEEDPNWQDVIDTSDGRL